MKFFPDPQNIDMREEFAAILYGREDVTQQGRLVIHRRILDETCLACWDPNTDGSRRPSCSYCQGEGRMFRERKETMVLFPGVAPVYKPGILGTGQYPQSDYGYTDPNRATAYCEYSVFPDYERYTLQQHKSYDKLYELKVNPNGSAILPLIRTAKWKILGVTPIHGDFGRVEYFELGLEKSNAD